MFTCSFLSWFCTEVVLITYKIEGNGGWCIQRGWSSREISRKMRFYVWNCYVLNFFPKSMSIETFIVAAIIHPRPIVNDEPCLWPRTMLFCSRWLYEGDEVWEPHGEARFAANHSKYPAELYHRYNRHHEDIGRTNYPSISPVVPPFPPPTPIPSIN